MEGNELIIFIAISVSRVNICIQWKMFHIGGSFRLMLHVSVNSINLMTYPLHETCRLYDHVALKLSLTNSLNHQRIFLKRNKHSRLTFSMFSTITTSVINPIWSYIMGGTYQNMNFHYVNLSYSYPPSQVAWKWQHVTSSFMSLQTEVVA